MSGKEEEFQDYEDVVVQQDTEKVEEVQKYVTILTKLDSKFQIHFF
jgi:hypothetical protein